MTDLLGLFKSELEDSNRTIKGRQQLIEDCKDTPVWSVALLKSWEDDIQRCIGYSDALTFVIKELEK